MFGDGDVSVGWGCVRMVLCEITVGGCERQVNGCVRS